MQWILEYFFAFFFVQSMKYLIEPAPPNVFTRETEGISLIYACREESAYHSCPELMESINTRWPNFLPPKGMENSHKNSWFAMSRHLPLEPKVYCPSKVKEPGFVSTGRASWAFLDRE